MTRTISLPKHLDLDSPGRRDYLVALEHDSIWGDHLMPLTVMVGAQAKPGQGLVAFGSNHGNEYEGPVVLKHLLREIRTEDVIGRIILVPVLNVSAFRTGTRESVGDDGVNMNRAFVEGAGTTPALAGITHRIAAFVRAWIWPRVHVVIDLHSGGDVARFAPVASFHPVDDPAQSRAIEDTARWFGTPLVMTYQNSTPGLLPSEAERLGKITVGTELGYGRSVLTEGVRYGRQGVLAAAIHHGQLRGTIEPIAHHRDGTQRKVAMVDRDCVTVAPFSGHFEPLIGCGEPVKPGDVVGWPHDFDRIDDAPWPATAAIAGIVIAQAWTNPVASGQHIVVVGRVEG
ncbi:MAG: succinylglutamate desuccinylase/aspartoacylase family protein [Planctomycetes bacterium]|nr:succinylglutamate desuccinylase/aspartoacylase family protein [Planctomycetota bacterium]